MKTTVAQKTIDLAAQFEAKREKLPTDIIPPTEEIESKVVIDFQSDEQAKSFATENRLKYPTEFVLKALINEGFVVSHTDNTKNLSSYYYDTVDRILNAAGISLRMRHTEAPRCESESDDFEVTTPDLSFKIPTKDGCTENRLEYQAKMNNAITDSGLSFSMSFKNLIERYTQEMLEREGAQSALQWARTAYETFGFDWAKYREHFSINCKRTKPYVTLYTLKHADGDLVRDEKTGQPVIHTQKPQFLHEGMEVREIVYQFCLDTNRFFGVSRKDPSQTIKYHVDHEVEFELQVGADEYEENGLASTSGLTYEEAHAARAVIRDLIHRSMGAHNLTEHKESGKSKQERGFNALDHYNSENPDNQIIVPSEFTIRGRTDLHKLKSYTWDQMVERIPVLKQVATAGNDNLPEYRRNKTPR